MTPVRFDMAVSEHESLWAKAQTREDAATSHGFFFSPMPTGGDHKAQRTVNRGRLSAPARSLSGETGCESLDPNSGTTAVPLTSGRKTRRPAMGVELTSARKGQQEGVKRPLAPRNARNTPKMRIPVKNRESSRFTKKRLGSQRILSPSKIR